MHLRVERMSHPWDVAHAGHRPHVVVRRVARDVAGRPFRRVRILGKDVGHAHKRSDVAELIQRAGLGAALVSDPGAVDWQDEGPDVWV
jgi:hypothetical protein